MSAEGTNKVSTDVSKVSTDVVTSEKVPADLEETLQGAFHLLGRLETDRVNTAKALASEQERIDQLRSKIEIHAYHRMEVLPKAVQDGMLIDTNALLQLI